VLDDIIARAEADATFRKALVADLEEALRSAGYEPEERTLVELRRRYADR
jgi:2-iminoacetate synthase ThiH